MMRNFRKMFTIKLNNHEENIVEENMIQFSSRESRRSFKAIALPRQGTDSAALISLEHRELTPGRLRMFRMFLTPQRD